MNPLPSGITPNLFTPPPFVEVGYGLLLTYDESFEASVVMNTARILAKNEGARSKDLPGFDDGLVGLADWYLQQKYPELAVRQYHFQGNESSQPGLAFVVISRVIIVGSSLEEILEKYDYELPIPEEPSTSILENFQREFGVSDEINWKHWTY